MYNCNHEGTEKSTALGGAKLVLFPNGTGQESSKEQRPARKASKIHSQVRGPGHRNLGVWINWIKGRTNPGNQAVCMKCLHQDLPEHRAECPRWNSWIHRHDNDPGIKTGLENDRRWRGWSAAFGILSRTMWGGTEIFFLKQEANPKSDSH